MSKDQAERVIDRIMVPQVAMLPMNEKEKEVLSKILTSEVMSKAFVHLTSFMHGVPGALMGLDIHDPSAQVQFSRAQGYMTGMRAAIEKLFELVISESEEEETES